MARLLSLLTLCAGFASAAVTVTKTHQGPTGYEVTISYQNTSVNSVIIAALPHLTNQWQTSYFNSAYIDLADYKPGDYASNPNPGTYYIMNQSSAGNFTFTRPFPGGTYQYSFLLDCANVTLCNITTGQQITDPTNPPYETVPGSEIVSSFQVPYDAKYQYSDDLSLNQDYALPYYDDCKKGTLRIETYSSPGSISPSNGTHDYVVYLPHGYQANGTTEYPLLYLSHGGGGAAGDWQNQGYISNILDRLIGDNWIAPTVVVMPTWYGLLEGTTNPDLQENSRGSISVPTIAQLYHDYLFPHVDATYRVSNDTSQRAFAGLSEGGFLTYSMYVNYTSLFGYYGFLSGASISDSVTLDGPGNFISANDTAANPDLTTRGIYVSYGQFDKLFQTSKYWQQTLDALDIPYITRFIPWGFHFWNTWQDAIWNFGRSTLWKPLPVTQYTAHGLARDI
ncbi:hypothetical protein SEUCBS139899_005594 [Sporothrix eucalyptigena]|uniref:Alpha/beta-hydrolase n=1 Tax=Sporothrix eucalyptigena TaxID=1812306 RepID=A0ABP0C0Y9_9PEZI